MRKLPLPQFLKDATETMQASKPHMRAARAARENAMRLQEEVDDPNARLTPAQRAERRQEISRLHGDERHGQEAVEGLTAELQARLPRWIKITK